MPDIWCSVAILCCFSLLTCLCNNKSSLFDIFYFFVISQKAHCWCLFAWGGLPAHSCVPGSNKGQCLQLLLPLREREKPMPQHCQKKNSQQPWNGRETLRYDAGSSLGPGSKVRAEHDTGDALGLFQWDCDPGDPTSLVVQVQCTQPGLAQFGIAVLCPNYSIT